jgi:hypothetical protein
LTLQLLALLKIGGVTLGPQLNSIENVFVVTAVYVLAEGVNPSPIGKE